MKLLLLPAPATTVEYGYAERRSLDVECRYISLEQGCSVAATGAFCIVHSISTVQSNRAITLSQSRVVAAGKGGTHGLRKRERMGGMHGNGMRV